MSVFTSPTLLDAQRWKNSNIGLFGGTFNPPHEGQILIEGGRETKKKPVSCIISSQCSHLCRVRALSVPASQMKFVEENNVFSLWIVSMLTCVFSCFSISVTKISKGSKPRFYLVDGNPTKSSQKKGGYPSFSRENRTVPKTD